ncbi:hypothetical protein QN379_00995 [Glaciimonas sp. Gout2]|uniref:hypothetical protein n=1 Tax=unclassified Glaciimonas TaxID=2644401 RepID=UPI002B233A01|nr:MULTISPECIES: hypothetical protein [unclassified Glaciimonas]MEB0011851.1 hypothetical protein [Glaciimonas sp. Cout2]MEB0080593.1 hypothetical protein [Glaciimonas sp. Gout2]
MSARPSAAHYPPRLRASLDGLVLMHRGTALQPRPLRGTEGNDPCNSLTQFDALGAGTLELAF